MKKTLSLLLVLALVLGLAVPAFAASGDGTADSPIVLTKLGSYTATSTGDWVYYSYTAEKDGVLSFTSNDEWVVYINDNGATYMAGDPAYSASVTAGQTYTIKVAPYSGNMDWDTWEYIPAAGTVNFTLTLTGSKDAPIDLSVVSTMEFPEEGRSLWVCYHATSSVKLELSCYSAAFTLKDADGNAIPVVVTSNEYGTSASYFVELDAGDSFLAELTATGYVYAYADAIGSEAYPYVIEVGSYTAHANSDMSVCYAWTAPADGKLTVAVNTETATNGWCFWIAESGTWGATTTHDSDTTNDGGNDWHGYNDSEPAETRDVTAGALYKIYVMACDNDNDETVGTIDFTVSFEAADDGGEEEETPVDTVLELGDNECGAEAEDTDGNTYTYTATEDGTLTITVTAMSMLDAYSGEWSEVPADYIGMQFGRSFALLINGTNGYSATGTAEVKAGDTVTVQLLSYMGNAFKATVNLSMTASEEDPGEGGEQPGADDDGKVENPDGSVTVNLNSDSEGEEEIVTVTATGAGTITIIISGDPGYKFWYEDELPKSGAAETTYTYDVSEAGDYTFTITCYDKAMWSSADGTVTYTVTFTPSEGDQEVVKEEWIVSDNVLVLGENNVTLNENANSTLYYFTPSETGIYEIVIDSADIAMSQWLSSTFTKVEDAVDGKLTWTCSGVGQDLLVGLTGTGSNAVITITKTGEYAPPAEETMEWTYYVNTQMKPYTAAEGDKVTAIDVTDDVADVVFLGEDGYYHYGTADGPIVIAKIDNGLVNWAEAAGYGNLRVYIYEGDELVAKMDYNDALADSDYDGSACYADGVYYLSEELVTMLKQIGAKLGWYDPSVLGFYLWSDAEGNPTAEVDPDTAWLVFCSTVESTETEDEVPPTGDMIAAALVLMLTSGAAVVCLKKKEN